MHTYIFPIFYGKSFILEKLDPIRIPIFFKNRNRRPGDGSSISSSKGDYASNNIFQSNHMDMSIIVEHNYYCRLTSWSLNGFNRAKEKKYNIITVMIIISIKSIRQFTLTNCP